MRTVELAIDLAGSTTHPATYRSVVVTIEQPRHWSDLELRHRAAIWAGVSIDKVSEPRPAS